MKDIPDIENPIAELFDDPATNKDERYRRDKRDYEARRKANLSLHKWDVEDLGRNEERELIRRAQIQAEAEDRAASEDIRQGPRLPALALRSANRPLHIAGDKLVIRHHKSVRKIAGEYFGDYENSYTVGVMGSYEDRVAAGLEGLWVAARRFNYSRRYGLNASAQHWTKKYIREECRLSRKRGDSSDTRADRYVYEHRHATVEQVAKKVRCNLKSAQAAIDRARIYWHGHDTYHEGFSYDEFSGADGERCSSPSLKYSTRRDFRRLYDFYNYGQSSQESKCLSRTVDALAVARARRAERRLRALGRRQYALELAAKDKRRRLAELLVPDARKFVYALSVNTAATAIQPFTVSATRLNDSENEQKEREKPLPSIHDSRLTHGRNHTPVFGPLWHRFEPIFSNANQRMAALRVAVGNGDEDGKEDDAVCGGGAVHHAHRSNRRGNRQGSRRAG